MIPDRTDRAMARHAGRRFRAPALAPVVVLALSALVLAGCLGSIPDEPFEPRAFKGWLVSCVRLSSRAACDIAKETLSEAGKPTRLEVTIFSVFGGVGHDFEVTAGGHHGAKHGGSLVKAYGTIVDNLLGREWRPLDDTFLRVGAGGGAVPVNDWFESEAKEQAVREMLTGTRLYLWGIDGEGETRQGSLSLKGFAEAHRAAVEWLRGPGSISWF